MTTLRLRVRMRANWMLAAAFIAGFVIGAWGGWLP
jgi:hypothetical protein